MACRPARSASAALGGEHIAQAEAKAMRYEFATPEPPKLRVGIAAGRVEIETADTAETVVDVEAISGDLDALRVEQRGREIVVEQRKRFSLVRDECDVRIRLPDGADAELNLASANARAGGRLGSLEANTATGEVEIERVERDARVRAASGDIRLGSVGGKADVNTASGDVELGQVGGETSVRSASGDVRLAEAGTGVSINTASGDQTIAAVAAGRVELKSASGDCLIGIKRGSRIFVDARSMSGETNSEVDLTGTEAAGDGPLVELRVATMSGDIHIVRA
jgi:DUF4097 and DUF4098 domain-containing protein YvlB